MMINSGGSATILLTLNQEGGIQQLHSCLLWNRIWGGT